MSGIYSEAEAYCRTQQGRKYDHEVDFIQDTIDSYCGKGPHEILIIGCGPGEHSVHLTEQEHAVTGIDPEPKMIELAQAKSDATFVHGSIPGLPVEGPFDVVVLPYGIVNHLTHEELSDSIEEIYTLLTDDGLLMFDGIDESDEKPYVLDKIADEEVILNHHDEQILAETVRETGFSVDITQSPIGMTGNNTAFVAQR